MPASIFTPGAISSRRRDDGAHLLDHVLAGLAHVGQRVRGAGRHRDGQLVHAGAQRGLGAAQVGHQGHHRHAGVRECMAHHLGGVGHLRQQLGRHEGADLDLAQAGGHQRVDPAHLSRGGHGGLDRLQAVAGADFADQDVGRGWGSQSWVAFLGGGNTARSRSAAESRGRTGGSLAANRPARPCVSLPAPLAARRSGPAPALNCPCRPRR